MQFDINIKESNIIKVIGVGGGGCNAVGHMYTSGICGVDFAICNTDSQSMDLSPVDKKIQLGPNLTEGRGAGSKPEVGKEACLESIEEIRAFLSNNTKMVFVTAGMGGGTGTGAAPIIAQTAKEMGILTVGIVTIPFRFEGSKRNKFAEEGVNQMREHTDALIVVSNNKLKELYGNLSVSDAFQKADDILSTAAKGIAEIITIPGYINVDFEDVNTVMKNSGVAIMGTAKASGDDRASTVIKEALNSPLLEENDIRGAGHILLNITSGKHEVTMDEICEINEYVQEEAGMDTNLIWGNCYDENLDDEIVVTLIATGFESETETFTEDAYTGILSDRGLTESFTQRSVEAPVITQDSVKEQFVQAIFELDEAPVEKVQEQKVVLDTTRQQEAMTDDFKKTMDAQNVDREPFVEHERPVLRTTVSNQQSPWNNRDSKQQLPSLSSAGALQNLENQPAYLRKRVHLDDVESSSEANYSRLMISDNENGEPIIREESTYLHDNVD